METKKINDRFSFDNEATSGIRHGFYHTSRFIKDGKRIAFVTCEYENRTWEAYPFQTAMKKAVREVIAKTTNEQDLVELNEVLTKLGD